MHSVLVNKRNQNDPNMQFRICNSKCTLHPYPFQRCDPCFSSRYPYILFKPKNENVSALSITISFSFQKWTEMYVNEYVCRFYYSTSFLCSLHCEWIIFGGSCSGTAILMAACVCLAIRLVYFFFFRFLSIKCNLIFLHGYCWCCIVFSLPHPSSLSP